MKHTKLSSIIYAKIPLISGNFDRLRKRQKKKSSYQINIIIKNKFINLK